MPVASLEAVSGDHPGPRRGAAPPSPPYVLLEDSLTPGGRASLFENPRATIRCDRAEDVERALDELSKGLARGLHAAGFLSYELGYVLEPRLRGLIPREREQPLLWMGLFEAPRRLDSRAVECFLARRTTGGHRIANPRLSLGRADYLAALARIKDYIAAGDVYQINLTFKHLFDFTGDPLSLYAALRRRQRVAHGGLVRAPDCDILSLSPELFLTVRDGRVLAKPMKGTAARRPDPAGDEAQRAWLRGDEKSRAENLMIVDLLRNDLGRVAEIGSVAVPALFTVETYPTVHQMTSSVTARLRPDVGVRALIQGLFPCGSITGAPKVRAMEIIRELEPAPRGVYTGAVGMFGPDGQVSLNVAIRTLVLHRDGRAEMGIGSGIVHDSEPAAEFDECLLKARFLTASQPPFSLIETLRWSRAGGYFLLQQHMARLARSAAYFGYPCDVDAVRGALAARAKGFARDPMRVRLTLDDGGRIEISAAPLPPRDPDAVLCYAFSNRPVDRDDPFFYHKTTRRALFEEELARLQALGGCDEAVFVNDRGEVTEGSRTNVFVARDGRLLTPPLDCGLLDGTLRRSLFDDPGTAIEECVLRPADLDEADNVYLGNSVRGLMRARPVEPGYRAATAAGLPRSQRKA